MLSFLTRKLYYSVTSSDQLGQDLIQAASSGHLLQVQELLAQAGAHISKEDKHKAIRKAHDNILLNPRLSDHVKVISVLLEDSQDLEPLRTILEKEPDDHSFSVVNALFNSLSAELYAKLAVNPPTYVIANVCQHLFRLNNRANNKQPLANLLHFEHRLLIQHALDSNNVLFIRHFIRLGVRFDGLVNGKTPLDVAKENGQSDIVVALIEAIGASAQISEAEWQSILSKDDAQLRQTMQKIAEEQPGTAVIREAHAAVTESGSLLTDSQTQMVDDFFTDPNRFKYPKSRRVPFSVVKSEEGNLFTIFNGKARGLKDSRIGHGTYADVKYGQSLGSKQWCAIKILPRIKSIDNADKEVKILKEMNMYSGRLTVHKDEFRTKCYFFMPYISGISFADFLIHHDNNHRILGTQHQAILLINLLQAVKHLFAHNIFHRDAHARNLILNPDDFTLTFIDFGRSQFFANPDINSDSVSQLLSGIEPLERLITNPQLCAIFKRLKSTNHQVVPEIDEAIKEIDEFLKNARTLPDACLLKPPSIPILVAATVQSNALKRDHGSTVNNKADEQDFQVKRGRKRR